MECAKVAGGGLSASTVDVDHLSWGLTYLQPCLAVCVCEPLRQRRVLSDGDMAVGLVARRRVGVRSDGWRWVLLGGHAAVAGAVVRMCGVCVCG